MWEWIFKDPVKRITAIGAMITGVITASIAVANFIELGEPHWIATRHFVRDLQEKTVNKLVAERSVLVSRQISTELRVLKGQREDTKSQIRQRTLLLNNSNAPADPRYRELVKDQIDEYRDQLIELEKEIINLSDEARRN